MVVITTMLGVGFLFAILFLVKTNTLPEYLQVAIKGLKTLSIIVLLGGIGTWIYFHFRNNTTPKDFIGSWQHNHAGLYRESYDFLTDSTFYLKGTDFIRYGKWYYDDNILSIYSLKEINNEGLKEIAPPKIKKFEVIDVENDKIELIDKHEFQKSKIPFNLKEEFWVEKETKSQN